MTSLFTSQRALSAPCVMRTTCTHAPDSTVRKFQRHRTSLCVRACFLMDACVCTEHQHFENAVQLPDAREKKTPSTMGYHHCRSYLFRYLSGVCIVCFCSVMVAANRLVALEMGCQNNGNLNMCHSAQNAPLTGII